MTRWTLATVTALVLSNAAGCALTPLPPGRRVVLKKCTSCHTEPSQAELQAHDIEELLQEHEDRVTIAPKDVEALRSWAEDRSTFL